jgi:glycosyltransferase involved in cell wall biosynthesis
MKRSTRARQRFVAELILSRELRRHPVDVLHVQYTAPPFAPCPIVTTIHDLAFEHLPETFNRRSWMQLRLTVRSTARRAAQIITVSEYSREDIINSYGAPPEIVSVTPEAAPPGFTRVTTETELEKIRKIYGIESDYILSLCSIQPRKNLVRLIQAYSLLRRSHPEGKLPQLVLAGKSGWLDKETRRAAQREDVSADVRFTGYVADEHLNALYSAATCFVYPSYFEGFGLPILEAMKCGTPVIAGNRTSIPEVAGDAALLFDPFDVQSLVEALKRILNDSQFRAALSVKALQRASEFSWQTTARLTLAVYEKAVSKHQRISTPI